MDCFFRCTRDNNMPQRRRSKKKSRRKKASKRSYRGTPLQGPTSKELKILQKLMNRLLQEFTDENFLKQFKGNLERIKTYIEHTLRWDNFLMYVNPSDANRESLKELYAKYSSLNSKIAQSLQLDYDDKLVQRFSERTDLDEDVKRYFTEVDPYVAPPRIQVLSHLTRPTWWDDKT